MWKSFLDKSKCLLGFHEGPWQYRTAKNCTQVQTCQRCGKETERVEHRWSGWAFQADRRCDRVRTCARCAQTEKSLAHNWGEPTYVRAKACDRVAVCARCGEKEPRESLHVFNAWAYQTDEACTQVQTCSRCGLAGSATRLEHDWDSWARSEFYASPVRVCRHCGDMLVDATSSGGRNAASMQAMEREVNRITSAETPQQIRAALTGSSTLLTPAAEKYFEFAFDQYPDDDFRTGPLTAARAIVHRCREVGVDAALQEFGIETAPAPPPPVRAQAAAPASRPAPAPPARSSAPAAGPLDKRLFGLWRNTEFLGAGTPMMMSIESQCALDQSGRFEFVVQGNEVEGGTWTADGSQLTLTFDGEGSSVKSYIVDSSGMVWKNDSRFHLWRRIG